jgi:hypothetical protein
MQRPYSGSNLTVRGLSLVDVAETKGELASVPWLRHRLRSNGSSVTNSLPLISVLRIVLLKFIILVNCQEHDFDQGHRDIKGILA